MRIKLIALLLLTLLLSTGSGGGTVNASSWIDGNSGIYGGGNSTAGQEPEKKGKAGFFESSFAELIVSLGDGLLSLLDGVGCSVNTIIYGRVDGYASINYFYFELVEGNPYGLIGAVIYQLMFKIAAILMSVVFMYLMVKVAFSKSAATLQEMKSGMSRFILVFIALFLMPNIVDLLFYIKDIILKTISDLFSSFLSAVGGISGGDQIADLIGIYKDIASSGFLIDAAMYLSLGVLSLYFAFTYVSAAISTMIMFLFFPVFVIMSFQDKDLIKSWFKFIYSVMLTPIIDLCLLFIPAIMSVLNTGSLIIFISCMALIPARAKIRKELGAGQSMGEEMLGVGLAMSAMGAVKGAAKGFKDISSGISSAKDDTINSKMYEELASEGSSQPVQDKIPDINSTSQAASGTGTTPANAYQRFANTRNFENPEISRNLTNEQKAALYKKRAKESLIKNTAKGLGRAAGAGVALSGSMFMGPTGKLIAANIGGEIGSGLGSASIAAMQGVRDFTKQFDITVEKADAGDAGIPDDTYYQDDRAIEGREFMLIHDNETDGQYGGDNTVIIDSYDVTDAYGRSENDIPDDGLADNTRRAASLFDSINMDKDYSIITKIDSDVEREAIEYSSKGTKQYDSKINELSEKNKEMDSNALDIYARAELYVEKVKDLQPEPFNNPEFENKLFRSYMNNIQKTEMSSETNIIISQDKL